MKQQLELIMLPTTQEGAPFWIDEFDVIADKPGFMATDERNYKHLYLVSNEEIKEGDWYIFPTVKPAGFSIAQYKYEENSISLGNLKAKNIIATTDSELKLPQIPQDFIKYFVEKQGNVGKVFCELDSTYYNCALRFFN